MIVLNANGLISKRSIIELFINETKPLLIIIVESHVKEIDDDALIEMNGYNNVRCDSDSSHTGGVVMYIREDLSYEVILREVKQFHWWILGLKLYIESELIGTFAGVYRSPSPDSKKGEFIERFSAIMEELLDLSQKDCTIGGDFNIDWLKEGDYYLNKMKSCIRGAGLKQVVLEATRVSKDSKTLIDLVITDNVNMKCNVLVKPRISDHYIISAQGIFNSSTKKGKFLIRGKVDYDQVTELLKNKMGNCEHSSAISIENEYVEMRDNILTAIQKSKKPDIWVNSRPCPWFSVEIKQAMNQRDTDFSIFLIMKEVGVGVDEAWEKYKHSRNNFVNSWREAKRKYYEDSIKTLKDEPKKLWKHLKTLYKVKNKEMKYVVFDDEYVFNADQVANRLNDFFVNSIQDIVDLIPVTNEYEMVSKVRNVALSEFEEITSSKLEKIVKKLKDTKGPDEISSESLKKLWPVIDEKVTSIVKGSLDQRKLPKKLKTSVVVPIAKVKGSAKCSELRPINTLPIVEKLTESVVHETLMKYITENELLTECQSGFREQHSTETALQLVIEDWMRALNRGEGVVAVFLDYRRAFETINRDLLLRKLSTMYKIGGAVYEWLQDYLKDRFQKVRFNKSLSMEKKVIHGVPQGSKLGPLLFILYINDLSDIVKQCKIHMFADDTLIYFSGRRELDTVNQLNEELQSVSEWLVKNSLSVNVGKTKCMAMGTPSFVEELETRQHVSLMNTNLEWVRKYKYLGVMIDNRLNFKEHADYINGKMAKKVNILCKLRKVLSKSGKQMLFKLILMPHVRYCSTILSMVNKTDIAVLQRTLNKGLRAVLNKRRTENVNNMLQEMGYLTIEKEIKRDVLTFIYRLENKLLPSYLSKLVMKNSEVHKYETRQADKFHIGQSITGKGKKTVFNNGIIMYNALTDDVKQSVTVAQFRKRVGVWLENQSYEVM